MIKQFQADTALLVIDAQRGVNLHAHWGGGDGHRNNPDAEAHIGELLSAWRAAQLAVYFTLHNSRESKSPLKLALASGKSIAGLEPNAGENVIDACAAGNRRSPDGKGFDADTVHRLSVANLHAEFCTALTSEVLVGLLKADAAQYHRVQGNE